MFLVKSIETKQKKFIFTRGNSTNFRTSIILVYINYIVHKRVCELYLQYTVNNLRMESAILLLKIKTRFWCTVNMRERNVYTVASILSQQRVFMEKPRFGRATGTDNAIAREGEWTINRGSTWFVWGITTRNGVACLYRRVLTGSSKLL